MNTDYLLKKLRKDYPQLNETRLEEIIKQAIKKLEVE